MAAPITLTATTAEGQIAELLAGVAALEAAQPVENRPNQNSNISFNYDEDAGQYVGTITLDATTSVVADGFTVKPVEYLV